MAAQGCMLGRFQDAKDRRPAFPVPDGVPAIDGVNFVNRIDRRTHHVLARIDFSAKCIVR
jgi:hypothetical protein